MPLVRVTGDTFTNRFGTAHDLTAADDSNTLFGTTDDVITVTNARNFSATGQYFIFEKKIIFSGTAATMYLTSNGTTNNTGYHCDFINCDITLVGTDADGFGVAAVSNSANRSRDGRVASGAASTASVNLIGCVFDLYDWTGTKQFVLTDIIDSEIRFGVDRTNDPAVLNQNRGARNINITETYINTNLAEHNFYGAPANYDSPVVSGARLRIGSGAGTEQILIPDLQQEVGQTVGSTGKQYWSFGTNNDTGFVVAGFRKVLDVANDSPLGASEWNSNGTQGRVVYCQQFRPRTFTNPSLATNVQNVDFQITSNANIPFSGSFNNIQASARSQNYISRFTTNAEGTLVPVEYSLNNGGTYTTGFLNYGQNETSATTTGDTFISTVEGQTLGNRTTLIPIQIWQSQSANNAAGFAPTNTLDVRSFGNDIQVLETIQDSNFNEGDAILGMQRNFLGESLIFEATTNPNGVIKRENVHLTGDDINRPNMDFSGTAAPRSINDIRDAWRAGWSERSYNVTNISHQTPISITIDSSHSGTNGFTGTANSLTIRASELATTAGDITTTDANLISGTLGGVPISNHNLTFSSAIGGLGNLTDTTILADRLNGGVRSMTRSSVTTTLSTNNIIVSSNSALTDSTIVAGQNITLASTVTYTGNNTLTAGGTISGLPTTISNLTLQGGITFATGQTVDNCTFNGTENINFASTAADGTSDVVFSGTVTFGNNITLNNDSVNYSISAGATVTWPGGNPPSNWVEQVAPTTFNFNIDSAFRGRVVRVYRDGNLTGTGAWTLIDSFDFTSSVGSIGDLNSSHTAFNNSRNLYLITVGTQYALTITEVQATSGASVTVLTTRDVNYNAAAAGTIPDAVTMALDVEEQSGNNGSITVVMAGADINNALDDTQTNGLLGLGRNDVDYITEIVDGGRVADFISFPSLSETVITANVNFRKTQSSTPQQYIQNVTGFRTESTDGVNPDVVNFPPSAGITPTGVRAAAGLAIADASLPTRPQIRQDITNTRTFGAAYNSDGSRVTPTQTPTD